MDDDQARKLLHSSRRLALMNIKLHMQVNVYNSRKSLMDFGCFSCCCCCCQTLIEDGQLFSHNKNAFIWLICCPFFAAILFFSFFYLLNAANFLQFLKTLRFSSEFSFVCLLTFALCTLFLAIHFLIFQLIFPNFYIHFTYFIVCDWVCFVWGVTFQMFLYLYKDILYSSYNRYIK